MVIATITSLQQEAIYGSSWLSNQTLGSCSAFQTLYEAETCCSGSTSKEFVVFERPTALCDIGWRSVTLGGVTKCLTVHPTAVWTKGEATTACQSYGSGVILVEPRTTADDTAVKALISSIDESALDWQYFWIGLTQSSSATVVTDDWTWDSDSAALTDTGWQTGQPTAYTGASDDGPEDCALYRKGYGWYDFGCSPAARVVCMAPYFFSTCWGVGSGFSSVTTVDSGGQDLCLNLLTESSYSRTAAVTACSDLNAQLYYPTTVAENAAFATWVYSQTSADAKVWMNIVQDKSGCVPNYGTGACEIGGVALNSNENWKTPSGDDVSTDFEDVWATSDPETSEKWWRGQDYLTLLVVNNGTHTTGTWQDVSSMTTGSGAICVKGA